MSLKIAYIYFTPGSILGVNNKIIQQSDAIMKAGLKNLDILVLNPEKNFEKDNLYYIKYQAWPGIFKYCDYFLRHSFWRYNIVEKNLPLKNYDYLILRYPRADKSGIKFFNKYNIITEHHSKESNEFINEAKNSSNLAVKAFKYIRYLNEIKYKKELLIRAKGIIGVTDGIIKHQSDNMDRVIKSRVIPNGINVDKINFTGYKKFDNKNLNLILLGSKYVPWHGIDRIVKSILAYQGVVNIRLHIVGDFNVIKKKYKDIRIKFHGIKKGGDLDQIFKDMNLAVGSMALYINKMKEGSPLKTREYIARGIPFMCAYRDADLDRNKPQDKFYIKFPNDNSLIDFNKVIDFVESINRKNNISKDMRYYASKNLDWSIKIKEYYNFIKEIHKNK